MTFAEQTLLEIQARKIDELTALSELLSSQLNDALMLLQKLAKLYEPNQN